ncbi:hypothetical protein DVK85_08800 [Flavobacterium arcticum]|uniref:Uncharacterized protein n=1 Tax=Flavobacterium arcticum TaxID=1784713 RepID=A0A345HCL2_9FLAO|nr:hypothetical protein [Flavobacterium arcticum]AXG74322.1 hypothetical protein DVK85_08800 [Flavobacterium arcticum]KAF2507564.1 EbsA family protein [Flavobacterium arcticum]
MKHYFKHNNGYINIDEENLYLTKTGNWQEVRDIKERIRASSQEKETSKIKKLFYWCLAIVEVVFLIYIITIDYKYLITNILFIFIMNFVIYIFHKRDFGKQAIIPLNQIEAIEPYKNGLKISFKDVTNKPDFEILKGVEEKGIEFLMNLEF